MAAFPDIVLPNEFDASKLSFYSPKVQDNGAKVIYLSYEGKKLFLQTPEMSAPFGMSKWDNDGKVKYSLDLSFKGKESREVLNKFFENMRAMDKKLVEDGLNNSQAWFKKKYTSFDVVDALYTPVIKFPKDKNGDVTDKYPPTMKLSLPHNGTQFTCDVYDKNKNPCDLTTIETKGSRVSAIIQCTGIWIAGSKFGCSWRVKQLQITPPATIKGYAFRPIDDDDEKDIDEDDEDPKEILAGAAVASDDEDVVDESEDELDAKPTKRVVRKK